MSPFDRARTNSYSTVSIFSSYSELFVESCKFFLSHVYLWVTPWNFIKISGSGKLESLGYGASVFAWSHV